MDDSDGARADPDEVADDRGSPGAAMHALFYVTVYPALWLLFWPMRNYQRKHHPEEYAESQRKK